MAFLFLSFFLSGLHWHLSGLSELELEQRPLQLLAGEPFPFFSFCFRKRASFFHFLVGLFSVICTRMLLSSTCRKHSTAQSAISPQSNTSSTCRSERDHASKQTTGCRALIQFAAFSRRTNKSKSARPTKRHEHNRSQSSLAGVIREGFAVISNVNKIQHYN